MPSPRDLIRAAKTAQAPRVQDGPSYEDKNRPRPPRKSRNAMSLEEFMRRNKHATDGDAKTEKVKTAQEKAGQRSNSGRNGRPNMRDTVRSRRDRARKEQVGWYEDTPEVPASTKALSQNKILSGAVMDLVRKSGGQ